MNKRILLLVLCWSSFALRAVTPNPVGLLNERNTCFINASLQALYAVDDLVEMVAQQTNQYIPNSISSLYSGFLNQMIRNDRQKMHPVELATAGWRMMRAAPGTQQSADLFITGLLNHLTSIDLTDQAKAGIPVYKDTPIAVTPASRLFYTITCMQNTTNGYVSPWLQEIHSVLPLPIADHDFSLYSCLRHFFENGEQIPVNHNGENIMMQRKHAFIETQPYIIMSLKRNQLALDAQGKTIFDERTKQLKTKKRTEAIRFPIKGLNLQNFYSDKSKQRSLYDLVAVIMHQGEDNAGHYIAYVYKNGQWYLCNDETIQVVSEEQMARIGDRGWGTESTMTPTLFIYEHSEAVQRKALMNKRNIPTTSLPVFPAKTAAESSVSQPTLRPATSVQYGAASAQPQARNAPRSVAQQSAATRPASAQQIATQPASTQPAAQRTNQQMQSSEETAPVTEEDSETENEDTAKEAKKKKKKKRAFVKKSRLRKKLHITGSVFCTDQISRTMSGQSASHAQPNVQVSGRTASGRRHHSIRKRAVVLGRRNLSSRRTMQTRRSSIR